MKKITIFINIVFSLLNLNSNTDRHVIYNRTSIPSPWVKQHKSNPDD